MPRYRLYFMNSSSGHIDRYEEYDAVDDVQAVRAVVGQAASQPLELWCDHRKVRRFEAGVDTLVPTPVHGA